ncbi:hypothetical protein ACFL1N_04135 [Thermodesulfobacteriota bacterium]
MSGFYRVEKLGKPGVYVCTDNFVHDAESAAEDVGMPRARIVIVKAAEYYRLRGTDEEIIPVAEVVIDELIDGLKRPLTEKEASTDPEKEDLGPTTVSAETYALAMEKFNDIYLGRQWGDGLTLVPTTKEAVEVMLEGTSRSPDEVIGTVAPKNGAATIEKIAINAVMAGAKPEYLPVIIAAMEGITDPDYDDLHVLTSTGSFNFAIMVTGPIAKELSINSGIGFLGYGWQANSTIGRAVQLAMINIGRLWPGINDMALVGRPSKQFYVFAENQDFSPWPPFHVTQGFKAEDSCVTVSSVIGLSRELLGGGAVATWAPEDIFNSAVNMMLEARWGMATWKRGSSNPGPFKYILFFEPVLAMELSRQGHTRASLQKLLYDRATIPYEELTPGEIANVQPRIDSGEIPEDRVYVFKDALKPGGRIPIINRLEDIRIVVAGGIPGYSFGMSFWREGLYAPTSDQTKLIRGATITKAGR